MELINEVITNRELEILYHISECCKNSDIAKRLCISCYTVESHKANLIKKLKLNNSTELTAFAIKYKEKITQQLKILKANRGIFDAGGRTI